VCLDLAQERCGRPRAGEPR